MRYTYTALCVCLCVCLCVYVSVCMCVPSLSLTRPFLHFLASPIPRPRPSPHFRFLAVEHMDLLLQALVMRAEVAMDFLDRKDFLVLATHYAVRVWQRVVLTSNIREVEGESLHLDMYIIQCRTYCLFNGFSVGSRNQITTYIPH